LQLRHTHKPLDDHVEISKYAKMSKNCSRLTPDRDDGDGGTPTLLTLVETDDNGYDWPSTVLPQKYPDTPHTPKFQRTTMCQPEMQQNR